MPVINKYWADDAFPTAAPAKSKAKIARALWVDQKCAVGKRNIVQAFVCDPRATAAEVGPMKPLNTRLV